MLRPGDAVIASVFRGVVLGTWLLAALQAAERPTAHKVSQPALVAVVEE